MEIKQVLVDLDKKTVKRKNKNEEDSIIITTKKEPKKRVITTTSKWELNKDQLDVYKQLDFIKEMVNKNEYVENLHNIIYQQLMQKISGYKMQDIKKGLYNDSLFITYDKVLQKMIECNLTCFYCKSNMLVLYENCREPLQWSLERIDNSYGHNTNNTVIACLNCNLRRRTMYHERFLFTKELTITKEDG